MKKSMPKNIQTLGKLILQPSSDLDAQIYKAHPLIQNCISELCKEIVRLQRQNAKQQIAHFSALEKLKAECAEEIARDKMRIYLPEMKSPKPIPH